MTTDAHQPPAVPAAPYDSRPETLIHSLRVGALMVDLLQEAMRRAVEHDLSKTQTPEVEGFDRMTPALKGLVYGTPEYKASLAELGPALAHHYAHNPHHPEHHDRGVNGMTLVDLMEMIADWKASTERVADGDLRRSVEKNMARFGIGEQLAEILLNTAEHFEWIPKPKAQSAVRVFIGPDAESPLEVALADGTVTTDIPVGALFTLPPGAPAGNYYLEPSAGVRAPVFLTSGPLGNCASGVQVGFS